MMHSKCYLMEIKTIFIIIWAIGIVSILTLFYIRGKKALSKFPDIKSVKIVYRDKAASAYAIQSGIKKPRKANKVLDIVVTNKELWVKSRLVFAGVAKQYDLIHKVPLKSISNTELDAGKITIEFKSDTETKQLVLITAQPKELLNALDQ